MKFLPEDLLTQGDVDRLPNDTQVDIIWSGGNGPCTYWVKHTPYGTYAQSSAERIKGPECLNSRNQVVDVGVYPMTQVRLHKPKLAP